MSTSYFIKSKLNGNVIDIKEGSTKSGALLDVYPQKSRLADNQLWEFIADPAGSEYYFIKSKLDGYVIDIKGASTLPLSTLPRSLAVGAQLDVSPQKAHVADSQLWEFVVDPAGSGYFLIVSKLNGYVIDIQGASSSAGALLDAYPWKFTGYDNQLWAVVDGNFPSVVETVPLPAGGYHGSGNYILANGSSCASLTGIRATIILTEELVWEPHAVHPGFSIQLNAETKNDQPLDWLQFMVHMGDDKGLWPWINIWSGGDNPQILWDQAVANPVATMPQAERIPAGYSIMIALLNDVEGRITGASWAVLNESGNSVGSVNYSLSTEDGGGVAPADLSQVASFQVTFGGALDEAHATFSSGAGVIILEADQPLTVDTSYSPCIGYIGGTAETSNMGYGALGANPNNLFAQAFGIVQERQVRAANPSARKLTAPSLT
jgi:hypothetical protein